MKAALKNNLTAPVGGMSEVEGEPDYMSPKQSLRKSKKETTEGDLSRDEDGRAEDINAVVSKINKEEIQPLIDRILFYCQVKGIPHLEIE